MDIDKDKVPTAASELRRRAEKRLRSKKAVPDSPRSENELRRLVHELEVHRIELCGPASDADRKRTLRPRKGRVHRGAVEAIRPF